MKTVGMIPTILPLIPVLPSGEFSHQLGTQKKTCSHLLNASHPLADIPGGGIYKIRQIYSSNICYNLGKHSPDREKALQWPPVGCMLMIIHRHNTLGRFRKEGVKRQAEY